MKILVIKSKFAHAVEQLTIASMWWAKTHWEDDDRESYKNCLLACIHAKHDELLLAVAQRNLKDELARQNHAIPDRAARSTFRSNWMASDPGRTTQSPLGGLKMGSAEPALDLIGKLSERVNAIEEQGARIERLLLNRLAPTT
jgi:hypothetical protein